MAFSTPWFEIEESISDGASEMQPYYRMTASDGIICLPLTPEGQFLMIRQYRPSLDAETLEIPAGAMDGGESPYSAAHREVLEETGYKCGLMCPLGSGRLYLNRCTQREHLFLGIDAVAVAGASVEAGIAPILVSRASFHEMVLRDEMEQTAVLSLIGLASAKLGIDLIRDPIEDIRRRVQEHVFRE
ncbi:MAG: NUDIX hydrolase [Reyranella sp.]|nr:NUDIX hydrolase [Reyranella sp.]